VNVPYRKRANDWNKEYSAIEGSTYLDIPFPLSIFTHGIEFHHIHHLNSNVPSYQLSNCHNSIPYSMWEHYNVNNVSCMTAIVSMFNVMYDEDKNRLIQFSYARI
jgi:omega-6 fatty acid desaturase (delta-12 desaturase)